MHRKLLVFQRRHLLPILIHILIIPLILTGRHIIDPFLVIKVPTDGFFDAFFELECRFPSEFVFEFGGVYSVSQVVPGPVCDVGNQFFAGSFRSAQEPVDGFDDDLYQVDVLPFVEASDGVC